MTNVDSGSVGNSPVVDDAAIAQTALAYDVLAERYENLQMRNPVLAHSARVSFDLVRRWMSPCDLVLEIGSGTGRETLKLAALGKKVVALDTSRKSLSILREKAEKLGLSDLIVTRLVPASRAAELVGEFGARSFDGAFSSFALSYEPDLTSVPGQVWQLLKPGARFLCSIFNRFCLTELMLLAPFLVPRRGLRRLEGIMMMPVDRFEVPVKSYSVTHVKRLFAPHFTQERVWAILAIMPPNYLQALVKLSGGFRPIWEELDLRLGSRWPFKFLGSHTAYLFGARN